jgi:hypothetical protein
MMRFHNGLIALALMAAASIAHAGPPKIKIDPVKALAALGEDSPAALSGTLRRVLLESLPSPLYVDERHWGGQKEFFGTAKNHGEWWKVKVTADNLPDTLILDLRDVQQPEPGRLLFTTYLAFDSTVDYSKQEWKRGIRLYSDEVRTRMRVKATLQWEMTARVADMGAVVPDTVFRLHVVKADVQYDNLVVEHVAGLGGETAKLLGDAAVAGLHQWRPSFESDLLAKADAAIVKSADTKEVHLELSKLFGKK